MLDGLFAEKDSERFNIETKGITKEFKKQILEDGMHFEFGPMYQMIVLEDLLDIILSMAYENNDKNDILKNMLLLKAAYTVLHPDRNIAFFNDSAFSVATPYDEFMKYASNLGINTNINKSQNNFKSGGFYKF